jgi:hypothetical protein
MTTQSDEAEALLARLHNDHVHKFVVRTEDKLREHFAGAIEAARARGLAPVFDFEPGDDDDELVEPAPAPAAPQPPTLYKRARDLAWTVFPVSEAVILAAARKAGIGRKWGRVILFSPEAVSRDR